MGHIASAIIPIFLLIGLGILLKSKAGFNDEFWRSVERLTFSGLFPSLLFVKISAADIDWSNSFPIASAIIISILLTAAATVPFRRLLGFNPEQFVAVFQGAFRSNAYVGIAITLSVFGDNATGAMAVTLLSVGVTINFLGVWGHLHWLGNEERSRGWRNIAIGSLKNPLIQACFVGALFNAAGWGLPPIIGPTLELLSNAALPMGLMAVGSGLKLSSIKAASAPAAVSCGLKLLLMPLVTFGLGTMLGLEGYALIVPVIFAGLPTSSTSYVVSRQMGSDAELMAAIVTASHLAAIFSMPVILSLIR